MVGMRLRRAACIESSTLGPRSGDRQLMFEVLLVVRRCDLLEVVKGDFLQLVGDDEEIDAGGDAYA